MSEVNWELLDEPQSFFQLDDGFNKKDLKRAYTRLIKVYKPEKSPDEFQKIRAAYEHLEEELAYGVSRVQQRLDTFSAQNFSPSQEEDSKTQLSSLSDQEFHFYLKEKTVKTEADYLALALLDEVELNSPIAFLKVLILGLSEYSMSEMLNTALYEFCHCRYETDTIVAILEKLTYAKHRYVYFYLTEQLFHSLLEQGEVEKFESCLSLYKQGSRGHDEENLCIFLLRSYKAYFFSFGSAKIEADLEDFNNVFFDLSDDWQEYLDLIDTLIAYDKDCQGGMYSSDLWQGFYRLLIDVLQSPIHREEDALLELKEYTLDNLEDLIELGDEAHGRVIYSLLFRIGALIKPEALYREKQSCRRYVEDFLLSVRGDYNRKFLNVFLSLRGWKFIGFNFGLIILPFFLIPYILPSSFLFGLDDPVEGWDGVKTGHFIAYLIYLVSIFSIPPVGHYFNAFNEYNERKVYSDRSRSKLICLFTETQLSEEELNEALAEVNDDTHGAMAGYIDRRIEKDFAPNIAGILGRLS